MKNIYYSDSFEKIWLEEAELKSRTSNRLFCIAFLICNPASSVAFYLAKDPFFDTLWQTHLISGTLILIYLFLNYKKIITGQQLSFITYVTLICFYAFLLSRPHLSYVQSCLNLTLAVIFAGLILRWPVRYSIICSALSILFFSLSILFVAEITLSIFFQDGGLFVLIANLLFPFINYLGYSKDKREFFYRYTLQEQNEALEMQKTIAENATRAKSNFLSMMSHEIRTSLNGIVGMVHLMLQEESNQKKPNELLDTLKFSADHLMDVVNGVLDFNKINSNHVVLDPQPFDTVLFFEILRKSFVPKATEKEIGLIFEIDPRLPAQLIADKVRLNQILNNLIHNAVKFTQVGLVKFVVSELGRDEKKINIIFQVIDTGIGIPKGEQEVVFDFFTQVKPKVQKENTGTGLGLAISKELLRIFESRLELQSEEGEGSVFSFKLSLPYSDQIKKAPEEEDKMVQTTEFPDRRVLVADDNKTNLVLVTQLLKRKNISFDIANNGSEAFELFKHGTYHLILMDLLMPVMDGFESTLLIRQIDKQIPIIALTASAFENEKERALANGFTGYLTKPFIPADFYNYILPFLNQ
ncbi:response regulator [Dyadobacter arcticus]|uniref:histidine kinase n=1 Tax=Dyadobacter arcticus TaxID=1078754 RepID=A0ABX0UJY3_9BACT|nr:response regulator [Dyadobacter arcticus]NIJ53137.1 signal transduction histidine kinase/CheY-like chemotaxis protein [Dyadobacter arcticus]